MAIAALQTSSAPAVAGHLWDGLAAADKSAAVAAGEAVLVAAAAAVVVEGAAAEGVVDHSGRPLRAHADEGTRSV